MTKGVFGHPDIARLADARVANVERMRATGIDSPVVLIRTPMRSQTDRIVRACGTGLDTNFGVVEALARSARRAGRVHRIVLMVEMGDGREGVSPADLASLARRVTGLRGVALVGIGANFACLSGRAPDRAATAELSALAAAIERDCKIALEIVSGGNSTSLPGLSGTRSRMRVNDLRLGEAILLGRGPITRRPIANLSTDAFVLVGEVIESAAGTPQPCLDRRSEIIRVGMTGAGGGTSLLALGDQDTDTGGLSLPDGLVRLGSTSDNRLLRRCAGRGRRDPLPAGLFRPDAGHERSRRRPDHPRSPARRPAGAGPGSPIGLGAGMSTGATGPSKATRDSGSIRARGDVPKLRLCLRCRAEFRATGFGDRIRRGCKSRKAWRTGITTTHGRSGRR